MINQVLITGVGGSASRYLIDYLTNEHPSVKIHGACRRKHLKIVPPQVKLHEVDLLDFSSILEALWESKPDVIFHFAANSDKGFETPSAILTNNAVGTTNLFEAIRQSKNRTETWDPVIVNVSTSEVYGAVNPDTDVPIKEACSFRPMSPYAISKVAQDLLGPFYYKAYKLKIVTTRAFSYINKYRPDLFTSAFARQIALIQVGKQEPILKHGNLDSIRAFVGMDSLLEAYWLAATKCKYGEAYNIGGSYKTSVGDVLLRMLWLAEFKTYSFKWTPVSSIRDPNLIRPVDVTLQIPDCSKFTSETGWKPEFNLDLELLEVLEYWRNRVRYE